MTSRIRLRIAARCNRFVRYKIRKAVRNQLKISGGEKNISLQSVWDNIYKSCFFRIISSGAMDVFNISGRDYVMLRCIEYLRSKNIAVSPDYYWDNRDTLEQVLDQPGSVLVVSLHNGFAFNVESFLDAGRKVSIIAYSTRNSDKVFLNTNITSPVNVIIRNNHCLAHLREAAVAGHILCCAVDFMDPATGHFSLISPALFDFSSKLDIPLYFSQTPIDPEGRAVCSLTGPVSGTVSEKLDSFLKHALLLRPHAEYKVAAYAA